MNAPIETVLKHKLRLIARWQADQEINEEAKNK